MTIDGLMEFFCGLYGRRSRLFINGVTERISYLGFSIGQLQDILRKNDDDKKRIEGALADVVSWIFCVIEHFKGLPVANMMSQKYSSNGCTYCWNSPCTCSSQKRNENTLAKINYHQIEWSLNQWRHHLSSVYGRANRERGVDNVVLRLFKENEELRSIFLNIDCAQATIDEMEQEICKEICDLLSWAIAVADLQNVDLELAVLDRFGKGCPVCGKLPCSCGRIVVQNGVSRSIGVV
jgi:NTP pyrophosphatase (non-canonical NTP hydrolase)